MYLTDLLSFLRNNCHKGDACYKLLPRAGLSLEESRGRAEGGRMKGNGALFTFLVFNSKLSFLREKYQCFVKQ